MSTLSSRSWTGALAAVSLVLLGVTALAGPPATGFVTVPGGKLFYEERGSGPAVILIHGGMLDHRMWDPQVEALARGHRLIRYDVAGHGRSPAPEGAWQDHEHLGLLMEALKVERASLVGLSLGGRIAIDFAIARPAMVRSLVIVGPGMSGFPFTGRDFRAHLGEGYRARRAGDAGRAADLFLRTWLAGPHRSPAQVDPAVWAKALEMAVPNALTMTEGSGLEPPAVGRLGEIEAPTLVLEGELDCEDIHLIARLVERRVPGTRRVVVPGAAHMPGLERPAEVNRLLVEFLEKPPEPPSERPPFPSRQEMVEVEGGKLWVERAGEGEPVVLIHDGIVHAVGWDDVMPALASQFEVVRYDRRGYGRSSAPEAPYSQLADLETVVRHAGLAKVHLVGSSAGGGLAIDFALAHPGQMASLTLVGAVVSGFPNTRHMHTRGGRMTRKAATDPAKDRFVTHPPPALPRLGSIRVPTLVLAGEHDIPDVHAHAGAIAAGIPHARRAVLAGSGHVPYLEQPSTFAATVLGFLQGAAFQAVLDDEGPARALEALRAARARDRSAILFPEDDLDRRGAQRKADGALTDAIGLYRLNTEAFPASANAWASLGEALLASGDRDGARAAYRKALEVDPATESAREALKALGEGGSAAEAPPLPGR